jgi:hypothetical protein
MTCQQIGCTRKADLACVVGDTRKVLCIEHQAKYREAMNCGGRKIVVHHGVNLDDWLQPFWIRHATVAEQLVVEPAPVEQLAVVVPDPFPPPIPPTTLRVTMPPTRPTCLWSDCAREAKQGPCCLIHNDRLRKIYGSAAKLSKSQINAAPEAWELRVATQYAARRGALVRSEALVVVPEAQVVVPVAPVVVPVVVPASKDGPNVALAIVLLENALKYTGKDARLDALLAAAMVVLQ